MTETNIQEREGLSAFLRKLLDQAGVRGHRIALTLPDTLARLSVVELDNAPRRQSDLADQLSFRIKKALPFGGEQIRLAFKPVPGSASRFFAGVMHNEVVAQYESLLEDLGFHVGVVETASLSLLNLWQPVADLALPRKSDYFLLNLEESYFSVVLVRERVPILLRTLGTRSPESGEATESRYQVDELVREIVPTLIFYREQLDGASPARVYYRSVRSDLLDLAEVLERHFEAPVEAVDLAKAVVMGESLQVDASLASTVGPAAGAALGEAA
jgi:Tfp pilus assembly PilM family ATPase